MLDNGMENCSCKKKKCVRHGNCKECIEYHNQSKSLRFPYCKRPKRGTVKFIGEK